ncbi:anti-sigma factor [Phormidium sp. CLA17]|uniref:anti-sigma factor n=1 Tax=Leptolyngbya sp. Cla-17 TaxID=2803751 RepID=UPI0014924FBB|nr:anti-sigma factor [Leptolyngbya sp. Cla-17]MBM0741668.1 anti-sigma factor [Leptolyngbya sp. Cla-17]
MAEPIYPESSYPEHWQELMAGYVLGNLTPEEAEELQQLLATHPELGEEMHSLQEVLAAMPYALPEVQPAPAVRSRILTTAQNQAAQNQTVPIRRHRPMALLWGGSIAAVIAVMVGVDNLNLRQQLSATQARIASQKDLIAMLQAPQTKLVTLKGMDKLSKAAGNVVITPGEAGAIVVLQDLQTLPPGQAYNLWAVTNGQKVSAGNFIANSQGRVFVKVPLTSATSDRVTNLIVTIETSPTPLSPRGPMVMTSSL